jgi:hypothetical protein
MVNSLFFLILNSLGYRINLVLSNKFFNLHSFTKLKVAILTSHASIEKFIVVNVAIVRSDTHSEHNLSDLCF